MELKNLDKAARRITRAVKDGERIILYGDADVDGAVSVVILQEAIERLGLCPVSVYFPDREKEGYGLNKKALKFLAKKSPALLITLDCGIGNVAEVAMAKELGFEVMILDHHQVLAKMPSASIIVDPRQKGEKYPFKEFACAGIIYRLAKVLLAQKCLRGSGDVSLAPFSEITAIATLFDQVPMVGENKKLIKEGLLALPYTQRPGIIELMKILHFNAKVSSLHGLDLPGEAIDEARAKIVSPLAAGLVKSHISETYSFLREKNPVAAKKIARLLIKKAAVKKETIKKMFAQAEAKMKDSAALVFIGSSSWPVPYLGPTASKICQKHKLPCYLFKRGKTESKGAIRVPAGFDAVQSMIYCDHLLIPGYGGHAPAAGFTIKNKNLAKFEQCLIEYFQRLSD
ncbi:MAG: DHH family phosphoesterase [Patescibacteria group bacterium]